GYTTESVKVQKSMEQSRGEASTELGVLSRSGGATGVRAPETGAPSEIDTQRPSPHGKDDSLEPGSSSRFASVTELDKLRFRVTSKDATIAKLESLLQALVDMGLVEGPQGRSDRNGLLLHDDGAMSPNPDWFRQQLVNLITNRAYMNQDGSSLFEQALDNWNQRLKDKFKEDADARDAARESIKTELNRMKGDQEQELSRLDTFEKTLHESQTNTAQHRRDDLRRLWTIVRQQQRQQLEFFLELPYCLAGTKIGRNLALDYYVRKQLFEDVRAALKSLAAGDQHENDAARVQKFLNSLTNNLSTYERMFDKPLSQSASGLRELIDTLHDNMLLKDFPDSVEQAEQQLGNLARTSGKHWRALSMKVHAQIVADATKGDPTIDYDFRHEFVDKYMLGILSILYEIYSSFPKQLGGEIAEIMTQLGDRFSAVWIWPMDKVSYDPSQHYAVETRRSDRPRDTIIELRQLGVYDKLEKRVVNKAHVVISG
ncbi:hypothetical protein JW905_16775, partial [bacterium]|nr:hypothetical protein [candidate division CSSED10-310 bacterium]